MTVNLPVARPTQLHRPLAPTGVLAVVLLPAMALDDRQLLGVSVWLEPWKFAVSITIYSLTVAWMVTLLPTGARLARVAAITIAAGYKGAFHRRERLDQVHRRRRRRQWRLPDLDCFSAGSRPTARSTPSAATELEETMRTPPEPVERTRSSAGRGRRQR
jgi:hypothetical protein